MKSDLVSILAPPSAFSTAVPGTPAKSQGWSLSPEKAERPWCVHTTLKPGVSLLLNSALGAVRFHGSLEKRAKGFSLQRRVTTLYQVQFVISNLPFWQWQVLKLSQKGRSRMCDPFYLRMMDRQHVLQAGGKTPLSCFSLRDLSSDFSCKSFLFVWPGVSYCYDLIESIISIR